MCLAVPGRIVRRDGETALADVQGNGVSVSVVLTPEVTAGEWVLIHAGFAIARIDEHSALETWSYLKQMGEPYEDEVFADAT